MSLLLTEGDIRRLATPAIALNAAREAFRSIATGEAENFPVVREPVGPGAVYGIKSGHHRPSGTLGLKTAGYWAANRIEGQEPHQASILLICPRTGVRRAVLEANLITSLRTAAAAALSVSLLARPERTVFGLIGAGGQAPAMAAAVLALGGFRRFLIVSQTGKVSKVVHEVAAAAGLSAEPCDLATCVQAADVLVTLTPSTAPLFPADWVTPGTHIAAMGSDTRGKRELPPALLTQAQVFGDVADQNATLGEGQGSSPIPHRSMLGDVLLGHAPGRQTGTEITIWDSTGFAVQDLTLAAALLSASGLTA